MSTILSNQMIADARGAVDGYVSKVQNYNQDLQSIINTLTGDNFIGDAADGYREFFNSKILPAVDENLIGGSSLTSNIKAILDAIEQQLISTVDPALGNNNRSAGGGATSGVAGGLAAGAAAAASAAGV